MHAECLVKQEIDEHVKQFFLEALRYMDSHRDRRVVKALLAEVTNIRFASKVQGLQSRERAQLVQANHLSQSCFIISISE